MFVTAITGKAPGTFFHNPSRAVGRRKALAFSYTAYEAGSPDSLHSALIDACHDP